MSEIDSHACEERPKLTKRDFVTSSDVRWCPRCGDYAILSAVQKVFPELGIPRENFVVVSGIGCSSRFPYYINTYGFHTIHGRAPAIATGVKVANKDLNVWVVTGDGDGLSIGGNHLMHCLRRNLNVTILLFNNRIYGLTKGQYSPTSELGKKTKTTPMGSIDHPINPLCFAIAAEATFVARAMDTNPKHMASVFKSAAEHKGVSFVEIFQNCVIFNDKAFEDISGREVRDDRLLILEQGKPLIFGKDRNLGIRMNGLNPEVVRLGENGVTEKDLVVHNENDPDPTYAYLLTQMQYPDFPTPMGIFRSVEGRSSYDEELEKQTEEFVANKGKPNLQVLLNGSEFWEVGQDGEDIRGGQNASMRDEENFIEKSVSEERKDYLVKIRAHPTFKIMREPLLDVILFSDVQKSSIDISRPIAEAIEMFEKDRRISAILVYDKDVFKGILCERDILMHVVLKDIDRNIFPVDKVFTNREPKVLEDHMRIGYAFNQMALGGCRYLPVSHKGEIILISIKDVLAFIRDKLRRSTGKV